MAMANQEIRFGDNDTLSAITSSMLHADYLFLLTDVDALYTANPRKDPTARPIDVVSSVESIRSQGEALTVDSLETRNSMDGYSEHCDSGLASRNRRNGNQANCS
jgi:glutamate 5-kinase